VCGWEGWRVRVRGMWLVIVTEQELAGAKGWMWVGWWGARVREWLVWVWLMGGWVW
jgi:hypothetical protein